MYAIVQVDAGSAVDEWPNDGNNVALFPIYVNPWPFADLVVHDVPNRHHLVYRFGVPRVRAVVAGEPATVLYTGMLTTGDYGPRLAIMANPERHFTAELRQRALEKLKLLRAPVLILHSDQHDLHKLNGPLFVPLMREAGVRVEYREYPGYGHGFYFGGGDDRWGKGSDSPPGIWIAWASGPIQRSRKPG